MDLRICFRVHERRDVDLVLGQGMLNAGRHARTLNAPASSSSPPSTIPAAPAPICADEDEQEPLSSDTADAAETLICEAASSQDVGAPDCGW